MRENMSIWVATPKTIWAYKQNHPELVVKDIERELESYSTLEFIHKPTLIKRLTSFARQSMLVRGINKWLKVRRDLIAYKKALKHEMREAMQELIASKELMKSTFVNFNDNPSYMDVHKHYEARGKYLIVKTQLKMLIKFRKDLKKLCMTERWQVWEGKEVSEMNDIRSSD